MKLTTPKNYLGVRSTLAALTASMLILISCGAQTEASGPISITIELEEFADVSRTVDATFLNESGAEVASASLDLGEESGQSVELPEPGTYTVELSTVAIGDPGCGTCQTFFGGNTLTFQAADGMDLVVPLDVVAS